MTTTASSGLLPPLSHALEAKGYDTLTEVQEAMLAPELLGQDLLVSAQTGSGKTVAFGLAIGHDILQDAEILPRAKQPLALIVAPTRELAVQVSREFGWLYREARASIATCIGGMEMRGERQALSRGAHIVVGTPGRLVDHIARGSLDLSSLLAVVLDEADEMLNLGFREELESILEACPEERRTLMFSATVDGGIGKLASRYQKDALRISAGGSTRQHDDIAYRALITAQHDTERAIINTLRFYEAKNAIVFCSTRAAVARLTSRLANRGLSVVSMSGELSQAERTNALQAMRDGRARVCVATDVAARGIDLPGLELVIHADLPRNREALLHRSGRTGRAGQKGTSVLIVPPRARKWIERLFADARVKAEWANPPTAEEVTARDDERLLADPVLTDAAEVTHLAKKIVETYSPEQIAAALVRMHQRGRSAPEELSEVQPVGTQRERGPRREIKDAAWITLSVGRSKRAEPRWLLPMLCKAGSLKKAAIGAIRVREEETFVQLDAEGASEFLGRIGDSVRLEDGIEVHRADGPPPPEHKGPQKTRAKTYKKIGSQTKPKPRRAGASPRSDEAPTSSKNTAVPEEKSELQAFKRKPRTKPKGKAAAGSKKKKSKADGKGARKRPANSPASRRAKK